MKLYLELQTDRKLSKYHWQGCILYMFYTAAFVACVCLFVSLFVCPVCLFITTVLMLYNLLTHPTRRPPNPILYNPYEMALFVWLLLVSQLSKWSTQARLYWQFFVQAIPLLRTSKKVFNSTMKLMIGLSWGLSPTSKNLVYGSLNENVWR